MEARVDTLVPQRQQRSRQPADQNLFVRPTWPLEHDSLLTAPFAHVSPRALIPPDLNLNRKEDIWSTNDEQRLLLHRGVRQLLPVDDQDVPQVLFALCKRQLAKRRVVRGLVQWDKAYLAFLAVVLVVLGIVFLILILLVAVAIRFVAVAG
ncbi:hypothetical protein EYF80_012798 [Liparis tanakae]|uniref:Uncharacterized protein n=1 Tax=Liparis tanakae TaxID=230148 RepID=A0A4Z2II01_9TELE|nr:hypothetical protein EYF80_012798 [Liparis tanakae]